MYNSFIPLKSWRKRKAQKNNLRCKSLKKKPKESFIIGNIDLTMKNPILT